MSTYNRRTGQWATTPSVLEPVSGAGPSELPLTNSTEADPNTTTPPGSPPDQAALGFSSERPKPIKTGNGTTRKRSPTVTPRIPQRPRPDDSPQVTQDAIVAEAPEVPEAGPSTAPAVRKVYPRKPKKKAEKLIQFTNAFAPGLYYVKNPAGDFLQKESNLDVTRQVSQARMKKEKELVEEAYQKKVDAGEDVDPLQPLAYTLIIHPGSRNLRIGRASDFYPKEVPFCIARPATAPNRGKDPPVPGSRYKRLETIGQDRKRQKVSANGHGVPTSNGHGDEDEEEEEEEFVNPTDTHIEDLREYLRNRLRMNRLATDPRDGIRVKQHNAKVRPEAIPEHNDPYRVEWTEVNGKHYFVGQEALRVPSASGFKVRYPFLQRGLNTRDWGSPRLLMDDIATILHETLKSELDIHPRDYSKYSVVLLVPDHNDRLHLQCLVSLLFGEFGFKEMAIHQESYAAIFAAGMSTACVVDIGATSTSVACVDEGLLLPDTRIKLDYGGDDITAALATILQKSNFPYHELDLSRSMDWTMMETLKMKICTLEEHMVANISWDIYATREQGLTQKYQLRTYDENILAPLCFFDTRMIDFKEKEGPKITLWEESESIDDMLTSGYGEATGAMRACSTHLLPPLPIPEVQITEPAPPGDEISFVVDGVQVLGQSSEPTPVPIPTPAPVPFIDLNGSQASNTSDKRPTVDTPAGSTGGTPAPPDSVTDTAAVAIPTPPLAVPIIAPIPVHPLSAWDGIDVIGEAARSPLDAAIAAALSLAGTENKVKAAAGNILFTGGGSALKGLYPFIEERLPPLIHAKGFAVDVSIVPPPRNLNPRYVSWKGASVMCNLESLSDMWIGRDEWEAIGARSLKDRLSFL